MTAGSATGVLASGPDAVQNERPHADHKTKPMAYGVS
jgi:hypothetical protein